MISLQVDAPLQVLQSFSCTPTGELLALGNNGGFSGAQLWRVESVIGPLCLRRCPVGTSLRHLAETHRRMEAAQRQGLHFVPVVFQVAGGRTWTEHAGGLWELVSWLPGQADFHQHPTPAKLRAACSALARLHAVWFVQGLTAPTAPAIERRLDVLQRWWKLVRGGWQPNFGRAPEPLALVCQRAWTQVQARAGALYRLLLPWVDRPLSVQPCLCDLWHDHVLFDRERVVGIIDYLSMKIDHVAVDLARLLGSLVGDDAGLRRQGLDAYVDLFSLRPEELRLVDVLDQSGTVLGLANWLRWLFHDQRTFADPERVTQRVDELVQRVEGWG